MDKEAIKREDIIQALRELEAEGIQPSRKSLERKGINGYWIGKLIPEGLSELKVNLGLKITPQEKPYSVDELLNTIDEVVTKLGHPPTWAELRRETGITDKVFIRNFGKRGIQDVLNNYYKWLLEYHPESNNIRFFRNQLKNEETIESFQPKSIVIKDGNKQIKWPKQPGKVYGAPLNFGSMIYEPTNEQGVVFLFGIVSKVLGFSIEYIGTEFPDCEAKRYIEGSSKRQQLVRIEFEFKSREFNHIVQDCDLIVCWEDNWGKDCPLEVLELRSKIKELQKLPEYH